jgi:hypothetical protein
MAKEDILKPCIALALRKVQALALALTLHKVKMYNKIINITNKLTSRARVVACCAQSI